MPAIPAMLPALAAFSVAGISRLVAPWPYLPLLFFAGWAVIAWSVGLETAPDALAQTDESRGADSGEADAEAESDEAPDEAPDDAPEGGKTQTRPAHTTPRIGAVAAAVDLTPPTVRVRPRPREEFGLAQIVTEPVIADTPEMPPHPRPLAVRATALGLAFFGFLAAGGLVPDGLAIDRSPLTTNDLQRFVILNALVAGVVGYRLAALASPHRMDRIVRIVAVGQYAVPVAVGAFVLRSIALPVLLIPALLAVVCFLLTDLRESPDPVPQNQRLIEELAVIGVAVVAVVLWGLFAK
jgi:hypothetical protein